MQRRVQSGISRDYGTFRSELRLVLQGCGCELPYAHGTHAGLRDSELVGASYSSLQILIESCGGVLTSELVCVLLAGANPRVDAKTG